MKKNTLNREALVNERVRLAEFSLLLAVLRIDPHDFSFISHGSQEGFISDVEAIRSITSRNSRREDRVVAAYLPSFKSYFPDSFFVEQVEESDHHPGVMEDKYLEFWSAFDTITYRFWILFHVLKLKMLHFLEDVSTEELYWARFGGDRPSLPPDERRYLLLFRMCAPFFRGRRLLYERVLPAFLKKPVTVEENVESDSEIPDVFRNRLGMQNSLLGRDFYPGRKLQENFSTFRIIVRHLDRESISDFSFSGRRRNLLSQLMDSFTPAHMSWQSRYEFKPGLTTFLLGEEKSMAYLGFSTYAGTT